MWWVGDKIVSPLQLTIKRDGVMRLIVGLTLVALLCPALSRAGEPSVVFLAEWPFQGRLDPIYGPFDIACAPDGTILISDLAWVQHWTGEGGFIEGWELPPVGINSHGSPSLMAMDELGSVCISAGLGYVQRLTLSGSLQAQWRLQGAFTAFGIAVGSDGNVFSGDDYNRNIQKFSPDGTFLLRWGTEGSGPGQFLTVSGIAADRAGRIYALDSGGAAANHRVEVFDLAGNFLFQFGSQGTGDGQFEVLTDIAIGASGNVFITDERLGRVQEFAPDGTFIAVVATKGTGVGQLQYPAGIGTDMRGNVYVADLFGLKLLKFGPAAVAATSTTWGRLKADYRGAASEP